ncbi:MAG: cation diffusion facilitator family transporter [Victivallales bacterium]|nr:cation diffusion facilitator family transporter [Victivallales bacterium]
MGFFAKKSSGMMAVNLGLLSNIILAGLKTIFGIIGHSPALLSDGINSTSDVVYYVVVKIFMNLAHKPADEEHPYGHRQLESIAALVVGAFVMTTAVAIFWDAVNKVYDLLTGKIDYEGASSWALAVALFTVTLKIVLTVFTRRIGRKIGSPAIMALAYDHRNDIFAAAAAALGIFLGRHGMPWVDPLAGAIVALLILRTGIHILRESSDDLMDTVPGHELQRQIREVLDAVPGFLDVEDIRAHRFGPYLLLNLTLGVDGALSVAEGDRIATRAENAIRSRVAAVRNIYLHYHPAEARFPTGHK